MIWKIKTFTCKATDGRNVQPAPKKLTSFQETGFGGDDVDTKRVTAAMLINSGPHSALIPFNPATLLFQHFDESAVHRNEIQ